LIFHAKESENEILLTIRQPKEDFMKKGKRGLIILPGLAAVLGVIWCLGFDAEAQTRLRYSCSAQIYKALGEEWIQAFSKATGIEVEVHVTSSTSAVYRLMNDSADIASTTRSLNYRQRERGYVETSFCKNPLAIIVNGRNPVNSLTELQIQEIFCGHIANWKEVGGPDQAIVVAVPEKNTGAYRNFDRQVMKRKEIIYHLKTYKSTMAMEAVKNFLWAISFIAQADAADQENIKVLSLDGIQPVDPNYPYQEVFSFVTKSRPEGPVKSFIDFIFSDNGRQIMDKKGLLPLSR